MEITKDSKVGLIAREFPMATKVFSRYEMDFCCGGGIPLEAVCEKKGFDVDSIIKEIEMEVSNSNGSDINWDHAPLEDIIDHILVKYHRPLAEELPRLENMARKVLKVHIEKDPQMLSELVEVYLGLKGELQEHMTKEEQFLFPMIIRGEVGFLKRAILVMEHEHKRAGDALRKLRDLTNGFKIPEKACNTWRALWHGLEGLEASLHQHIHLENNILFPRAMAS